MIEHNFSFKGDDRSEVDDHAKVDDSVKVDLFLHKATRSKKPYLCDYATQRKHNV